ETADAVTLLHELRERNVEVVIARMSGPVAQADMNAEALYYAPMVVVAAKTNPWTRRRKIKLAELVKERWTLLPQGSLTWSLFVEAFRAKGLEPPPATVTTRSLHLRTSLLATGRFLTVLPRYILNDSGKHPSLKVVPVELRDIQGSIAIITLKNRTLSPLARLFIEHTRVVAKQIAG